MSVTSVEGSWDDPMADALDYSPTPAPGLAAVVDGLVLPVLEIARPLSPTLVPALPGGPCGWQAMAKRSLDVVISLVLLAVVFPVLVAAAVGVRLTSRGPVFFRQARVGRGGHHFTMYKFRTFPVEHVDAEFSLPVGQCPSRFGRMLRRASIDELPQLLNVLLGHMALVGPRPERPHFAEPLGAAIPTYRDRHRAPAGITGLAQVAGLTGNTSVEHRVRADNAYIEGWSIWRDIAILARTIPATVRKAR